MEADQIKANNCRTPNRCELPDLAHLALKQAGDYHKKLGPTYGCSRRQKGSTRIQLSPEQRPLMAQPTPLAKIRFLAQCRPSPLDRELPLWVCAVKGGAFQWVKAPPGETLQPEATGAAMNVTKWLKPSV